MFIVNAKILSVKTKEAKSALVTLEVSVAEKKIKYTISEGTYREVGCPLSGEYIDEDALSLLSSEDERRRAMAKSLSLLGYADNNEKGLYMKLIRAGFSREAASDSVEECVRLGYIDENRQLERYILKCAEELLGPYKIIAKLLSRGYSSKKIFAVINKLEAEEKIDFKSSKARVIESKLEDGAKEDDRRKLLYRYGYIK